MARRYKPQKWKLTHMNDGDDVRFLYTDLVLADIAKATKNANYAQDQFFREVILDVARWLRIDLSNECRPKEAEIRAAFDKLSKVIGTVRETLKHLDDDSKELLSVALQTLSRNPKGATGRERLAEAEGALRCLYVSARWAKRPFKRSRRGRPREDAIGKAVAKLAQRWPSFSGGIKASRSVNWEDHKERGEFRRFADDALRPLLEPIGMTVTDDAVKRALHALDSEARAKRPI